MNFKDQLTYRILKRFSVFTGRLSENRREKLARRLASFIYYLLPIRKKQALNNLKNAFPEKDFGWIKKQLKGTYNIVSNNFIGMLKRGENIPGCLFNLQWELIRLLLLFS